MEECILPQPHFHINSPVSTAYSPKKEKRMVTTSDKLLVVWHFQNIRFEAEKRLSQEIPIESARTSRSPHKLRHLWLRPDPTFTRGSISLPVLSLVGHSSTPLHRSWRSRLPLSAVKRFVNLWTEIAELINIENKTIVRVRTKSKSFFHDNQSEPENNLLYNIACQKRSGECFMANESPPNRSVPT